jgi:hypothetical protein
VNVDWGNWAGHLVLFGSALLTVTVFFSVKAWRKARQRRSPLAGRASVGHLPGQQLLGRIRHHDDEIGRAIFLSLLAAPLMFMVWASMRLEWERMRWSVAEWMFVAGALLMFLWGLLRDHLGKDVPVIPAVALPGWWVERTEEAKCAEVQVFSPMGRGPEFMAWQPERIDEPTRRLIAQTLAARFPVIEE